MITQDDLWWCHDGRQIKLKDLKDTHLSNIIHYVQQTWESYYSKKYKNELLKVLKEIVKERGLTTKFLDRSQIPYKNENGKWEIWSGKNVNDFIEVEK